MSEQYKRMSMGHLMQSFAAAIVEAIPDARADIAAGSMLSYSRGRREIRFVETAPQKQFKVEYYENGVFLRFEPWVVADNIVDAVTPRIAEFLLG